MKVQFHTDFRSFPNGVVVQLIQGSFAIKNPEFYFI